MSYQSGTGNPTDVKFKTLSCKGKVIIDNKCKLTLTDAKIKSLTVKNETINGNLVVNGCITGNGDDNGNVCVNGNINVNGNVFVDGVKLGAGGGGGGGVSKYLFNSIMNKPMSLSDADTIGPFGFTSSFVLNDSGHLYTGPVGSPILVKFLYGENSYPTPTPLTDFFIQEMDMTRFNGGTGTGVLNTMSGTFTESRIQTERKIINNEKHETKSRAPYSPTGSIKTVTVIPTLTNSYWHYYCNNPTPNVDPYIQTVTLEEL